MNNERKFYVYEWFIKDTGHIFHVGKGTGKRWQDYSGRNRYFTRICNKYEVSSRIYQDNLTESEAFVLEKRRIEELWAQGQCETNIHEGGCGGDTVSHMKDADYAAFCRKVGDKTLARCQDSEYRERLQESISIAMKKPEVREKVSVRTKLAMGDPEVHEKMWQNGLAHPVLLVYADGSYKLFKQATECYAFIKDRYSLSYNICTRKLYTSNFVSSYQTKNNPNISELEGARLYKINKKLFKSVTTMADECKSVDEILSLIEAHSSSNTEEIV